LEEQRFVLSKEILLNRALTPLLMLQTVVSWVGIDGAIHRKGGLKILEECKKIRETEWPEGLPTGKAVITTGGNLKARYVIHTVGPIWRGGKYGEPELLEEAYRNSLKIAISRKLNAFFSPLVPETLGPEAISSIKSFNSISKFMFHQLCRSI